MSSVKWEIKVIAVCVRMLQTIDSEERRRVTEYLHARYHDGFAMPEPVEPLTHNPIDGRFIRTPADQTSDSEEG